MNMVRKVEAARGVGSEGCEERHRPVRSLVWQVFGGFVVVVLTLALAAAGHMTSKADADDVRAIEVRTRQVEGQLGGIRSDLGELRAGQGYMREDLRYIRQVVDEMKAR